MSWDDDDVNYDFGEPEVVVPPIEEATPAASVAGGPVTTTVDTAVPLPDAVVAEDVGHADQELCSALLTVFNIDNEADASSAADRYRLEAVVDRFRHDNHVIAEGGSL